MSSVQDDQVFPFSDRPFSDQKLAQNIAAALHRDFGNARHAIKQLSQKIGVEPRTARNWYEAKNIPSLLHLLHLAGASPSLKDFLLSEISAVERGLAGAQTRQKTDAGKTPPAGPENGKIYCAELHNKSGDHPRSPGKPIRRQAWFLDRLRDGMRLTAGDISACFDVSDRAARADIASLKQKGLIRFTGAKKNG